ncbi:MAG TPA: polysaccharide deacetylase family protein [Candidatus Cybelea sp.]|nr:polysaccharide deacetylase family protein [Candidatus Cybelea sp.]
MNVVLRHLKNVVLSGFARAGIARLGVSLHARDALVLAYHGILREAKGEPFGYHHTAAEFESHLDWLGVHCQPVGLTDFARWKRGEWQPAKPPVLITFDDGYRNNATVAAPLLRRKGFPALFFINSGYVEAGRVLWPEEVFIRILAWTGPSLVDPNGAEHAVPQARDARERLGFAMVEVCKNCSDDRRREFMAYLARETPHCDPMLDREVQEILSWNEVCALANDGFDLGSHTVSHPILSQLSPEALTVELRESRTALEERTGRPCVSLAYPVGRLHDVTEAVLSATAGAGYEYAFIVSDRWCERGTDPLRIDRISTPGHSNHATFALHVSGSRRWFPR